MTKIAVLVGSIREGSLNHAFAKAVEAQLPEGVSFDYVQLGTLPLFDQGQEESMPAEVIALKQTIEAADGVFVVTPEYNRGYPGVLKNAIDWASRPGGQNSFNDKPSVLAGVSGGSLGATQAQSQLRNVLVYLNTHLMGQPEAYINGRTFFAEDGSVVDGSQAFVQSYAQALAKHITRYA